MQIGSVGVAITGIVVTVVMTVLVGLAASVREVRKEAKESIAALRAETMVSLSSLREAIKTDVGALASKLDEISQRHVASEVEIAKALAELRVQVARDYVPRTELDERLANIDQRLRTIVSLLSRRAGRDDALHYPHEDDA